MIDFVKSRLEKAGSVPKQAKKKGVDIGVEAILREIDVSELKQFPDDYIGEAECGSQEETRYVEFAVMNVILMIPEDVRKIKNRERL